MWAECQLDLTRTVYKTDTSASCFKVTTCEFSLALKESYPPKQVIVKLEPDKIASGDRYMYESTSIQSTCVARLWVYILLFLCCPAIVCIILSVLIYKCCSDPEQEDEDEEEDISDERSPLLWESAPSYSAVVTEPPKYEDIMTETDDRLPSYEEAVASGSTTAENVAAAGNVGINHSEPFQNNDIRVNRTNNLVNVNDLISASRAPDNVVVDTSDINTQGTDDPLNSFTGVSGSVNLDQTSRVLVMNLSGDVSANDIESSDDDIEPSSSDDESNLSDGTSSGDHSEQTRNNPTDTGTDSTADTSRSSIEQ
ncbi:uncharacterized protein LOC117342252 [Pecten maximus]|uniref:uncharacterized protein LOC117342252 n=1 Tax=Pecten maximus TaxID=6579 RepID=UPI00145861D2|nr:uncharacterized protein LOC117342252 [Pecten maximus]